LPTNIDKFNAEVEKFTATLVPEQIRLFQRRIVLELLTRIVEKTPVDTGLARSNWQVTISEVSEELFEVRGPSEVISAGMQAVSDIPPFSIVYITNNVPYIVFLERGHSKQAPKGMVEVSAGELLGLFS